MTRIIYLNGHYIPETEGKVSVFDRGFLFSDSVYEVVSVLDRKLVDFEGHVQRLARSLSEIGIEGAPDAQAWLGICRELVSRNAVEEGMIYWQVTRGTPGDRDFVFPPADTPPTVLAFTQSRTLVDNPVAERGLSVVTVPDLRWGRAAIPTALPPTARWPTTWTMPWATRTKAGWPRRSVTCVRVAARRRRRWNQRNPRRGFPKGSP